MLPSDPNEFIGGLALAGLAAVLFWRLIVLVRDAPVRPDPWDAETERQISAPDAVQTCPHCSTEQPPDGWFCPHCGAAVGPYNNLMPYVHIFSTGEVLRNGTSGLIRFSPLIITGYFLFALSQYAPLVILFPVYLFFLFRNLRRSKAAAGAVEEVSTRQP